MSNKDYNNEINKTNDQQQEKESAVDNNDNNLVTEFSLSENTKSLGVLRIAREHNTIVVEVKNGEAEDDPFVIRRAIDFKSWNNFIKEIKSSLFSDLQFEFEQKPINRITANVETIINKNYETIKNPVGLSPDFHIRSNQATNDTADAIKVRNLNATNSSSIGNKTIIEKDGGPILFLTINDLVKKQTGTFNTKGTIVSVTPIMQAISKINWKCSNDMIDANGNPNCTNPYNERIFDPLLLRLDGLKLRCSSCFESAPDVVESTVLKGWLNYIIVQIQDDDDYSPFIDNLQKITTLVYDQDVDSVHIGESVRIHGNIRVPLKSYDKPYSGRTISSNLSSVMYAESVAYERREDIKITEQDKHAFEKFVEYPKLMERLAAMVAPNVIGHQDKKIGIMLAAGGAPETSKDRRGRIHILLIGSPGTAKTTLAYEAVNLIPNSKFTAAQTSSVKTILAIVEVQGDIKIIRYGAIPLAKNAICVIDEIGTMSFEDQASLFNVMEHGELPLNKHGESRMIPAQTTIIGTSNPKNIDASWINLAKASKDEIPLRRALIDRFDIVLIFKDDDTEELAKDYASRKLQANKMLPHNYRFLRKFLYYIKSTISEITFTKEAEIMITKYYANIKVNKNLGMTNRALESLTRICKAWARLHLKSVVDVEIVSEVQKYFSSIILQYGEVIKAAADPREVATEEIVKAVKQAKSAILFEEAARLAGLQNRQVKHYFGPNLKLRSNNRLHEVSERVREYSNIKTVTLKPLVLEWISNKESSTTTTATTATTNNTDATAANADLQSSNNH